MRSISPYRLDDEAADHGICEAVRRYIVDQALLTPDPVKVRADTLDLWYAEKDAILKRWSEFSGDTVYPVPGVSRVACPLRT